MLKLLKRLRGIDLFLFFILIGFVVGQVYFDLKLPEKTSLIISQMLDPRFGTKDLWKTGGQMLLIVLGSASATVILGLISSYIASHFSQRIRLEVFEKIESMSLEEMSKFETSSLITRTTNDVQQVQMALGMSMRMLLSAIITAVWAVIKIKSTNVTLTLAVSASFLSLIILLIIIFAVVMPSFKRMQVLTDNLNEVTRENLTGIRIVRAYDAENYQQKKFDKANTKLTDTNLFVNRVMSLLNPAISLIMSAISLLVYWIGAYQIRNEAISYPDLPAFVSYSMQVLMSLMMVAMMMIFIPRASVSAKRILEVLNTENDVPNPKNPKELQKENIHLEFKDVSFGYSEAEDDIIKHVSFDVKAGETLAIIGGTGGGKTTLINLIPRFHDATQGSVLINDINIKDYNKKDLRAIMGYVPQKRVLFKGTVKSNVSFGQDDISKEELEEALYISNADEFVSKMEGKENASIAQGGKNVSGGQMQRLSIARAIARKPKIYLFDDSFSALDYKTDQEVRHRLKEITKDSITIIVAQRIGTIKDADKIIVLDHGSIAGYGKHEELLKTSSVYKEIALSQLSKEELGL